MGSTTGLRPKSLKDKSVIAYSKAKSEGRGFDSLPKGGSVMATRVYNKKKSKEINVQQLIDEDKTYSLGKPSLLGA